MQHATFIEVENADRDGIENKFVGLNIDANDAHNYTTSYVPANARSFTVAISDDEADEITEFLSDPEDAGEVTTDGKAVTIERY